MERFSGETVQLATALFLAGAEFFQFLAGAGDLEALGLDGEQGGTDTWKYLTILTIPEQGPTTVNLAAPIVINPARNIGVQAVRSDRRYSHAQLLEQAVSQGEPC